MIKELKTKVMKGYDKAVEFSTKYEDYILIGDIVILSTLGLLLIGKKLKSMDTKSLKQMFIDEYMKGYRDGCLDETRIMRELQEQFDIPYETIVDAYEKWKPSKVYAPTLKK